MLLVLLCAAAAALAEEAAPAPKESVLVLGKDTFEVRDPRSLDFKLRDCCCGVCCCSGSMRCRSLSSLDRIWSSSTHPGSPGAVHGPIFASAR